MFLCEILTEQRQAPPALKSPNQNVHVHVHQPAAPKEKAPKPEPVQQVPVQAQPEQQGPDAGYGEDEYDPEMDGGDMPAPDPFQELLPLKRYYLVLRLKDLKSQLDDGNIKNPDFDIVIKFINNLSYNSLVMLSNSIIPVVEEQIARLNANAQ